MIKVLLKRYHGVLYAVVFKIFHASVVLILLKAKSTFYI